MINTVQQLNSITVHNQRCIGSYSITLLFLLLPNNQSVITSIQSTGCTV